MKDTKTSITREATASEGGTFLFPDLASGLYEVTVSRQAFARRLSRTSRFPPARPRTCGSLEVGQTTETVTITEGVRSAGDLQPIGNEYLSPRPLLNCRSPRQRTRARELGAGASPPIGGDTRYNNLPGGAVNVTVDGINDASNGFKSGGTVFFMTVPVRLGAVDEVSVETGGLGADSGAQSGANIKFTTRRGGDQYHGSVFYEPQSERFNANTWSRNASDLPRVFNRTQNYGGNFGGPLIPFGSFKKKSVLLCQLRACLSPVESHVR